MIRYYSTWHYNLDNSIKFLYVHADWIVVFTPGSTVKDMYTVFTYTKKSLAVQKMYSTVLWKLKQHLISTEEQECIVVVNQAFKCNEKEKKWKTKITTRPKAAKCSPRKVNSLFWLFKHKFHFAHTSSINQNSNLWLWPFSLHNTS